MMSRPMVRNRRNRRRCGGFKLGLNTLLFVTVIVLVIIPLMGCGQKDFPKPPEGQKRPPPVTDLAGKIEGDTLNLSWTVPPPTDQYQLSAAGFDLLAYRQPLEEPCSNCPPNYKVAAQLRVLGRLEKAGGKQLMRYPYTLEAGYRYTFVVISVSSDGTTGPESNTIKIER